VICSYPHLLLTFVVVVTLVPFTVAVPLHLPLLWIGYVLPHAAFDIYVVPRFGWQFGVTRLLRLGWLLLLPFVILLFTFIWLLRTTRLPPSSSYRLLFLPYTFTLFTVGLRHCTLQPQPVYYVPVHSPHYIATFSYFLRITDEHTQFPTHVVAILLFCCYLTPWLLQLLRLFCSCCYLLGCLHAHDTGCYHGHFVYFYNALQHLVGRIYLRLHITLGRIYTLPHGWLDPLHCARFCPFIHTLG